MESGGFYFKSVRTEALNYILSLIGARQSLNRELQREAVMQSKTSFFSLLMILSLCSSFVYADSEKKSAGFILQVAAFPETAESEAENFITKLAEAGEQPIWGTVDLPGRGNWMRVFIGTFKTQIEARQYGEQLVTRRLIKEFIIKKSSEIKSLSRPRSVIRKDASRRQGNPADVAERLFDAAFDGAKSAKQEPAQAEPLKQATVYPLALRLPPTEVAARPPTAPIDNPPRFNQDQTPAPNRQTPNQLKTPPQSNPEELNTRHLQSLRYAQEVSPIRKQGVRASNISLSNNIFSGRFAFAITSRDYTKSLLNLAPTVDLNAIPRADAVAVVFKLIAAQSHASTRFFSPGGFWLAGDTEEGLKRLQWILGTDADLVGIDQNNKVYLDTNLLARRAGVKKSNAADLPLKVFNYLAANEGLLLLVQLTQSQRRFQLFLGHQAVTLGGYVKIGGSVNLDNNYDSRINPHRRNRLKLDLERPPAGFDGLIAINPTARWFNLHTNKLVPDGNITFHELAEAYAKVENGYEYLPTGALPGAHQMALEREIKLKGQRPHTDLVLTLGSNRVIKSDEEWRQFSAEMGGARQQ